MVTLTTVQAKSLVYALGALSIIELIANAGDNAAAQGAALSELLNKYRRECYTHFNNACDLNPQWWPELCQTIGNDLITQATPFTVNDKLN